MTEFKCDTRSHGNFLDGKNSLCLLFYTDCIIIVGCIKRRSTVMTCETTARRGASATLLKGVLP